MVPAQVQEELDALAVRLGRSLTVDGEAGELLAYSIQRDDTDPARVAAILLRHVAPAVREWERAHVAEAVDAVDVPANAELGMSARLCLPLRRGGRRLGNLWLLGADADLSAADRGALRRSGAVLAGLLDTPTAARPAAGDVDRALRGLLDDGPAEAYDRLLAMVPGLSDSPVRLIAAVAADRDAVDPDGRGVRPLRADEFGALAAAVTPVLRARPGYVGAVVSAAHVVVAQLGGGDGLLDDVVEIVGRCLTGGAPPALGVSDPVRFGPRSARSAREQALAAAELAVLDPALPGAPGRVRWSDLGVYRSLLATGPPSDAVLGGLDRAGGSAAMLLATLETYLDLGGDVRATAARLRLHRSSLYYRLDRAAGLLDRDLRNGLHRLELHLALKGRRAARRTLS